MTQTAPAYHLTWVTDQLAVGCAPMSRDQLASIREQGIGSILNLCAEFCDLHEIEAAAGFEVRYLPIYDEEAPDMAELEAALEWLDERLYLGGKALIHCRHGIGRTGTVLNAYLLRRGLGHRQAARILKPLRAKPANFDQWWTIRKYGRKNGRLTIREPSLGFKRLTDLGPIFQEIASLARLADDKAAAAGLALCGRDHARCCRADGELCLAETALLTSTMNAGLSAEARLSAVTRASAVFGERPEPDAPCPLLVEGACVLFEHRPLRCRTFGLPNEEGLWAEVLRPELGRLSRETFFAFASDLPAGEPPRFSLAEAVSGRYAQRFFKLLMAVDRDRADGNGGGASGPAGSG